MSFWTVSQWISELILRFHLLGMGMTGYRLSFNPVCSFLIALLFRWPHVMRWGLSRVCIVWIEQEKLIQRLVFPNCDQGRRVRDESLEIFIKCWKLCRTWNSYKTAPSNNVYVPSSSSRCISPSSSTTSSSAATSLSSESKSWRGVGAHLEQQNILRPYSEFAFWYLSILNGRVALEQQPKLTNRSQPEAITPEIKKYLHIF